jgi:GT2 family glycosyltransferase
MTVERTPADRADVTVVIPAYNAADTLEACLAAISRQSLEPREVIVVDDGSTDATADVASRSGAKVMRQGHAGRGAARNRGASAAVGELLLFTDADCVPARDWIEHLVAPLEDAEIVAARGVCKSDQREVIARFAQLEYEEKYQQMAGKDTVDVAATDCAAYRRSALLQWGGFDQELPASEDQELSFRLRRAGLKIAFAPRALVHHRHRPTVGEYIRRKFWIGYAKAGVGRRHPGKLISDAYTPQSLKLQVACAALAVLALALTPIRRRALPIAGAAALGFAASAGPIVSLGRRHDPALTPWLPALLLVRALALGAGLAAGSVGELRRRAR